MFKRKQKERAPMSISFDYFKSFVESCKKEIENERIIRIIQVSSYDFFFSLLYSKKAIHISLNAQNPFIALEENKVFPKLTSTNQLNELKKHLENARLLNFEIVNDDKILCITFRKTYDNFEILNGKIYCEFITNHPNLIIVNENNKIIYANRYSSLESKRPLIQGITYESPKKSLSEIDTKLQISDDFHKIQAYDSTIEQLISKSLYGTTIKKVNNTIKQLHKKIDILNRILLDDMQFQSYKDAGDYIYSHLDEDLHSFKIGEKEFLIDLRFSLTENANRFYKKYKKLKEGQRINMEFLDKANKDLQYFTNIKSQIEKSNLFDIEGIISELEQEGFVKPIKKAKKEIKSIMPYFVLIDDIKIGFGKNNIQNETLTFSLSKPKYYFLHVKDYSGSHVVIFSDDPSPKVIDIAAKLALFLSKQSLGDVLLADIKDVKKSNVRGLVNIIKFQTIHINSYNNEEIEKIYDSATRE